MALQLGNSIELVEVTVALVGCSVSISLHVVLSAVTNLMKGEEQ